MQTWKKYRIPIPISRYFEITIPNTKQKKYRKPIPTSNTETDPSLVGEARAEPDKV